MSLFVIVATRQADKIAKAIQESGFASFDLRSDAWIVHSNQTTRQLAEILGIRSGQNGAGLVCLIENYSGRLPSEAWEWIRAHGTENE
jgi:hypothetical protein